MNLKIKSKGFTLVELMITVGVIAIISAIAIPAYTGYIETGRKLEGQSNLEILKAAQTEYFSENNTFFVGSTNAGTLASNSGGLWAPAEADADRQFEYKVVINAAKPAATPPTPETYTATATGRGNKVPTTVVITYNSN